MAISDAPRTIAPETVVRWESETRQIISDLRRERLKAEQRRLAAERQIAEIDNQISVLEKTINQQRAKAALDKVPLTVDPADVAMYVRSSPKEMLITWAHLHNSEVVMKDAAEFLAAAGLFRDKEQAAGTLYPTIRRMDEFTKATRGVYRRVGRVLREVELTDRVPEETDTETPEKAIDLDDTPF